MKTLRLILGDQLNYQHSWFRTVSSDVTYIIAEIRSETDYCKHHIQKICAFFLAMQNFADHLKAQGHNIVYKNLNQTRETATFSDLIRQQIKILNVRKFEYLLPDEYRLDQELKSLCSTLDIESKVYDSEHFYVERNFLKDFFKAKKSYLMESFYRELRKKNNILMQDSGPIGDQWNFDSENRKRIPANFPIPEALLFHNDCKEILERLTANNVSSFGVLDNNQIGWPVSREQAIESLRYFCRYLLPNFGNYQDAMLSENRNIFHSRLSFALNTKILSPKEVVDSAIMEWQKRPTEISLPQVEGFVRQILGWREYMRGVYWAKMPQYSRLNFFNHKENLPDFFWTGKTKMNCLKQCIEGSLQDAYAHHIQRLMITGNFCLMAGIDPDLVDLWYLGIYIDAIEWVEITNTRGMSQYADGGIVGSKPYLASANYINKMSNYCSDCNYNYKLRYGDKACPFNSLYWNFFERHRDKLANNPRIGMSYVTLNKMSAAEKEKILSQAKSYLEGIEEL